ncbi:hypothetical protein [Nocardia sp. alder85J]|uniref:hypothetical protein n=1 Tax=Nocardia sp. alder85J TaxID=2862949 RepID=UPI001CD4DA40|nr:hypothetical protein [Nocardia sp. alder85J]MCX4098394.1 hypothetical protein [Nocardia sp. alder85J]
MVAAQLAGVENDHGNFGAAEGHYLQAIENFRGTPEQITANQVASMLGILPEKTGRSEAAFAHLAETAAEWRRLTGDFDATHIRLLSDLNRRLDEGSLHNALSTLDQATRKKLERRIKRADGGYL